MNNTVIKVKDKEHGKKVIEYFKSKGVDDAKDYIGNCTEEAGDDDIYYGVIASRFANYTLPSVEDNNVQIIELPEENGYPKVMMVWDRGDEIAVKRVVFIEKNGIYIAWQMAETIEDAEKIYCTKAWNYGKEVVEEKETELTLQEIAEKFGVSVDKLRIKK